MKLYYIGVIRNSAKPPQELCSAKNVSSFGMFQQTTVSQFLTFFSGEVAERTPAGSRADIQEQSYTFHVYSHSRGCAGVIVSDHDYPKLTAHKLLNQVVEDFLVAHPAHQWSTASPPPTYTWRELETWLNDYQDAYQADKMLMVQNELDETKIVLHKTIESLLERGEKIDNLVERSNQLSGASKMFYKQAKKQNSCCTIV